MAYRVGDWVEIRCKDEILATLDRSARLDGLPFMPQMFEYCGKRFKVHKSAHKTCDPVYTTASRGVTNAVHLELRCNGKSHGGCQAGCPIFWNAAWLKPASGPGQDRVPTAAEAKLPATGPAQCTEEDVQEAVRRERSSDTVDADTQYVCQTTELLQFSRKLPWWMPTQYFTDYASGNVTLTELLRGGAYVMFGRKFRNRLPVVRKIYNWLQTATGGHPSPEASGLIPVDQPVPISRLGLEPGDLVRVKTHEQILATLTTRNMHRGMYFDVELVPFCGGTYRVNTQISRFIDEKTGRIKSLKSPAVILDTVVCKSQFSRCRMFCPRGLYSWWREEWLERVDETRPAQSQARSAAATAARRAVGEPAPAE